MIVLSKFFFFKKIEMLEHTLATCAAGVSRFSMLLIILLNTQMMSPTEFGFFAVLLMINNMILAFVSCGGDMWLNRFSRHRHTYHKRAPIISRFYFQISSVLASFVVFCALGFMFFPEAFEGQGLAVAFSLLLAAAAGMIEAILAILRTTSNIQRFFIIRDLLLPVTLIFFILFFKVETAREYYLISFILWFSTFVFLLRFILNRKKSYMPPSSLTWKKLWKALASYTIGLISNNFLNRLSSSFDTLILIPFLSVDILGKYRLVSHFTNALTVVQHFVFLTLPWHLRKSTEGVISTQGIKAVNLKQKMLLISIFPIFLGVVLFSKFLLGFLGEEYLPMAFALSVFMIFRFNELLWGPQHEALISNNKVFLDTLAGASAIILGTFTFVNCIYFFDAIKSGIIAVGVSSVSGQFLRYYILKRQKIQSQSLYSYGLPWIPLTVIFFTLIYVVMR